MSHTRSRTFKQQVFETAFVSSRFSSTEDLDEVDRIANHPLLQQNRLRKSRSAMGGSVDRGVSAFLERTSPGPVNTRMSRSTTLHLSTVSATASPVQDTWSFPFRPRSALTRIMRLTKPHSCDNILEQTSPAQLKKNHSRSVNNILRDKRADCDSPITQTRDKVSPYQFSSSHSVNISKNCSPVSGNSLERSGKPITQFTETVRSDNLVPSPSTVSRKSSIYSSPALLTQRKVRTAPTINSPLSVKVKSNFSSGSLLHSGKSTPLEPGVSWQGSPELGLPQGSRTPDKSLCRVQVDLHSPRFGSPRGAVQHKPNLSCQPGFPTPPSTAPTQKKIMGSTALAEPSNKFDFTARFASESNVSQLAELRQSSSAESTPQKTQVIRSRLRPRRRLELQLRTRRYQSSSSSSCLSSWESLDSNTSSQGYGSESSSVHEETKLRKIANLNILSPISDKSGEQVSPSSDKETDPNANPPYQGRLDNKDHESEGYKPGKKRNLNLNLNLENSSCENVSSLKSLRTPDIQQYLNVPWDMPKLKKKLQNRRKFCFSGETSSPENSPKKSSMPKSPDVDLIFQKDWSEKNNNEDIMSTSDENSELYSSDKINPGEKVSKNKRFFNRNSISLSAKVQGSDSGISMSSQEMKELLDVPWSMPKLKRNAWIRTNPTPGHDSSRHGRVNDSPSRTDQINLVHADSFSLQTKDKPSPTEVNKENIESEPNPDIKNETKFQDLSDLPFSIPKLERKLREQNASSSSLEISKPRISIRPLSLFVPVPDSNPDHDPSIFINSGINLRNQDVGTNPGSPHFSSEPLSKPSLKPLSLNLSGPSRDKTQFSLSLELGCNDGAGESGGGGRGGVSRRRPGLSFIPQLNLANSVLVDVDLPLERQEWYHGILSKTEVENTLRTRAEGSYLVRAKGGEGEYSLAIKSAKGFIHMRLSRGCGGGFRLGEEEREFNSVVEMVKHYSLNRLPIKGAEHLCLITPATEELL